MIRFESTEMFKFLRVQKIYYLLSVFLGKMETKYNELEIQLFKEDVFERLEELKKEISIDKILLEISNIEKKEDLELFAYQIQNFIFENWLYPQGFWGILNKEEEKIIRERIWENAYSKEEVIEKLFNRNNEISSKEYWYLIDFAFLQRGVDLEKIGKEIDEDYFIFNKRDITLMEEVCCLPMGFIRRGEYIEEEIFEELDKFEKEIKSNPKFEEVSKRIKGVKEEYFIRVVGLFIELEDLKIIEWNKKEKRYDYKEIGTGRIDLVVCIADRLKGKFRNYYVEIANLFACDNKYLSGRYDTIKKDLANPIYLAENNFMEIVKTITKYL